MASEQESERCSEIKKVLWKYEKWHEKLYGQRNIGKWQAYMTRDRKRLNIREIWQVAGKDRDSVKYGKKEDNMARGCKFKSQEKIESEGKVGNNW